jgi:perosamine synthetase
MRVSVIGAGKMGLPLACRFAACGAEVISCDIRRDVVDSINDGISPIDEPGVPELLARMVAEHRLQAMSDATAATRESDVVVVIVPVLLTERNEPDLSVIRSVTRQIAAGLHAGMMISYETTLPVGGTRSLIALLEISGLKAGIDFDLVFSPERVKSQRVLLRLTENPKVVGGITPEAARRAEQFYAEYLGAPVINVNTLEAAELVKLAGMVYRDVNIALATELARYAEQVGVELAPVIAAANTDQEAALLSPGIGVGGHCTPIYPYFLLWDGERRGIDLDLTRKARAVNDQQPAYILDRVEREWMTLRNRHVLILGLGFRPQVKEHTCSPAFQLRRDLERRGAHVTLYDPLYSDDELRTHGFRPGSLAVAPTPEVIVLNTGHADFHDLDFTALASAGLKVVIDGRGFWKPDDVRLVGLVYIGVGRPSASSTAKENSIVPVSRPWLSGWEIDAAARPIRSGWVAQGPEVIAFEKEFAEYVGAPHACAVSSCTTALHLALRALGVGSGDEVITVSNSFIATANAVCYTGALPVFVDVDPCYYNMDPEKIEQAITSKTRAILCVHQVGMPCDLKSIADIAHKHRLPLVEDAACAIGSEILWNGCWERIGKPHGDVACFSFHPRKLVTTGDGGMLTTANADWNHKFRLWRQHSMSVPDAARHSAKQVVFEEYVELGYNYRMTDIQAAVGREQLKRLPAMLERRRMLTARYAELLSGIPGIGLPKQPSWARSNWQSYCVRLPQQFDQYSFMQKLLNGGISTRRGVMCAHREPAYASMPRCVRFPLTESEAVQDRTIMLPLYHQMTEAEQDRVVAAVANACTLFSASVLSPATGLDKR